MSANKSHIVNQMTYMPRSEEWKLLSLEDINKIDRGSGQLDRMHGLGLELVVVNRGRDEVSKLRWHTV